jgi:Xaa-Pro aminopeptidase
VEMPSKSSLVFPVDEYRSRLTKFTQALAEEDVQIYVGSVPEHLNYFTGFDPLGLYFYQQMFLTPDSDQPVLLTHKCEKELARVQCWIDDVRFWSHGEDPVMRTLEILRELGVQSGVRVGLEMDNWYLKSSTYQRLVDELPGVEFVDVTHIAMEQRMVKSPLEIEHMRIAASFADLGFATAIEYLRPGVREIGVHAAVQHTLAASGSEYPAVPTIIGAGPRSGLFHAVPSNRVIEPGDPVMFEITGVSARYNSNIVRTLVAGEASPLLKQLWKIVTESFFTAFEAVRPGAPVGEIDKLSREARRDYADYIPARAGFGMELAYPPVWLGRPDILQGDDHVLVPGMVFSLEPSVAQFQGVTVIFGYNILVTEHGAEILHSTPADVFEVGA